MSFLSKVTTGKIKKPRMVLIYGPDGCGKSTFGAQAPSPIFLGSEEGTNNLDVARFPPVSKWSDIMASLNELSSEKHEYKTLVIDSLDWIEPLLYQHICDRYGVKSIELAAGGYGKGFSESLNEWIGFNKLLSKLRDEKKMNVILIAHAEITKFSDPNAQVEYDRFSLKLYKKSSSLFREFVDCVLFANFEVVAKKDGTKTRAYGDGVRVMYTERRPGFDAKNRFGLPFSLPLSWHDFDKACDEDKSNSLPFLKTSINELASQLDEELKKKVIETMEKAGDNIPQLEAIRNRVLIILGEKGE